MLWLTATTLICWILFERADATAAVIHQRNVGIALVYIYVWLLAALVSPFIVFVFTRLLPAKGR
jgi:hypothetical protein